MFRVHKGRWVLQQCGEESRSARDANFIRCAGEMLTETTVARLATFRYRHDAARNYCLLPLSAIYWEDELPDIRELRRIPEDDGHQILRLFGL
jgi:hypothetical protein